MRLKYGPINSFIRTESIIQSSKIIIFLMIASDGVSNLKLFYLETDSQLIKNTGPNSVS